MITFDAVMQEGQRINVGNPLTIMPLTSRATKGQASENVECAPDNRHLRLHPTRIIPGFPRSPRVQERLLFTCWRLHVRPELPSEVK